MIRMTPTLERLNQSGRCSPSATGVSSRPVASRTTTIHARRGEILMREGATGRELFVIVEGYGAGRFAMATRLRRSGPGDICGELGAARSRPPHGDRRRRNRPRARGQHRAGVRRAAGEVPSLSTRATEAMSGRLRNAMASNLDDSATPSRPRQLA